MLRARLAVVVLAGGLGLVSGCSSLCNLSLFHRNRPRGSEVIDLGVTGEGPVLDGCAPGGMPPGGVPPGGMVPGAMVPGGTVPGGALTPQPTVPPLSSPPRIAPQPQSQPMPYSP